MQPLAKLLRTSPLPDGWSVPDAFVDRVTADGVELRRSGLSTTGPGGLEVTGAAASSEESPVPRSYYELLERACTVSAMDDRRSAYELRDREGVRVGTCDVAAVFPESEDPERWRYARSNGVALHADWGRACDRAHWELCERDRVLRCWYGETRAAPLGEVFGSTPLASTTSYAWQTWTFPPPRGAFWSAELHVAGVFGFPLRGGVPLVFGYGARPALDDATRAAVAEATQQLAFLWGEDIPTGEPARGPTALHHLERALWPAQHDVLRRWLAEGHHEHAVRASRARDRTGLIAFVDLTPSWLGGGLRVAKAVCSAAEPLGFGVTPFAPHLPEHLHVHPVA